jgi:hypothetical protein
MTRLKCAAFRSVEELEHFVAAVKRAPPDQTTVHGDPRRYLIRFSDGTIVIGAEDTPTTPEETAASTAPVPAPEHGPPSVQVVAPIRKVERGWPRFRWGRG